MNTSTENLQPGQQASSASKPLWAAVGILGVAVLAMGGTMIYQMRNPPAAAAPVALAAPQPAAPGAPPPPAAPPAPLAAPQPAPTVPPPPAAAAAAAVDDLAEKPVVAPAKPAPV